MNMLKHLVSVFSLCSIVFAIHLQNDLNVVRNSGYLDDVSNHFQNVLSSKRDGNYACTLCELVANFLIAERRFGLSVEELSNEATFFCSFFNIEHDSVCKGIIRPHVDIFAYLVDNNPDLDGQRICALRMQAAQCDKGENFEWIIEIPEKDSFHDVPAVGKNTTELTDSFKILHLSDIHFDPNYDSNKTKYCGEPLCCQPEQEDGDVKLGTACGYWSEMKHADTPMRAVEEVLRHASNQEFDFVYFTGDLVAHKVWATSVANNSRDIRTIFQKFREVFDVPVYVVVGNHEPTPVNVFSTSNETNPNISTSWLFELFAQELTTWVPEEATTTISHGGYYSVSPKEGFRVVVLNNNVASVENWWLIDADYDPYDQLKWLVQVLLEAEKNHEKVHILQHMPTGTGNMIKVWSREYNRIVERFSDVIANQFNGHSHRDEFLVYYDRSNYTVPINVAWNGASINSDNANPSYKIYEIDSVTLDMLDNKLWTFNLTEANLNPEKTPEWYELYGFKDAYGLSGLSPNDLDDLVQRMTWNHSLIDQFHNFRYREGGTEVEAGCDTNCKRNYFCTLTVSEYMETKTCESFQQLYDANEDKSA